MTRNERVLVEYWLSVGKVRREWRDMHDRTKGYRYYFQNHGIEFELRGAWTDFFQSMNTHNHLYFQSGIEGAEILLNGIDVTEDIIPFDPWENPHFISLEIPKLEFGGSNQIYRCVDVLKN